MAEYEERRPRGPIEHKAVVTRAGVFVPVLRQAPKPSEAAGQDATPREDASRLEEAVGLAAAIDLDVVASAVVPVAKARPATLIGAGKVEELKGLVAAEEIGLVIVDHPLTPVQQRNLEKELGAKVLDRTGLILEIFGRRARTKEGRLQVELAHLNYQKGRLVRSWTHLERQRGGAGFMGGPGETQIESDRRQLQEKIARLEKELEAVKRTRTLHRSKRKKAPHPVVALVGYTNAGKSTLFNAVTGADVLAKNLLFATLDPTLRRITLPHGTEAIISDTVGFISDLPTHLVAAFRATLEEVIEAELVLHVRDMSNHDASAQGADVNAILADLDIDTADAEHVVEVWNKIDLLDEAGRAQVATAAETRRDGLGVHLVSAVTGEGVDALLADIEKRLAGAVGDVDLDIPASRLQLLQWVYDNAAVHNRDDRDDGSVSLTLGMTSQARAELRRLAGRYPEIRVARSG
ncbi:GTPase HflX [Aureimonas leprariae]|uniref:GTPase HflX n=1 Tax=Plantimonas leprariae TaxID=2615207 RepID=A0A7V7PRZ1_9HYPH|nr:GTPase HflX [Aureimonas leprariae]KAB0681757.1 GTPase HflX [Aureimonas leprariae]